MISAGGCLDGHPAPLPHAHPRAGHFSFWGGRAWGLVVGEFRSKTERVRFFREIMVQRFPLCFVPRGTNKKPLAIGIREQVIARCSDLSPDDIALALRDYTRGLHHYRSQLFFGAGRVDLDGKPCGSVSREDAEHAGNLLMERGYPELAAPIALSLRKLAA